MSSIRKVGMPGAGLLTAFVLLGFLPLLVLSGCAVVLSKRSVQHDVQEQAQSLNTSIAALVSRSVGDLPAVMTALGGQPEIQRVVAGSRTSPAATERMLQLIEQARPDLNTVFITDAAGNMLATAPPMPGVQFPNFSQRDWYIGAAHTDAAYLSNAYVPVDKDAGVVVSVAVRVKDPAQPGSPTIGYLVGLYRLGALQATVDTLHERMGASILVTDRAGTVVAAPGLAAGGLVSEARDSRVVDALAGISGTGSATVQGHDVVTAYAGVPGPNWAVVVDIPKSRAFASYRKQRDLILGVATSLALVMLGALYWAGRIQQRRLLAEKESAASADSLLKSQERFRLAFVNAPVGMLRLSPEGFIQDLNLACSEVLCWRTEELVGRHIEQFFHPDDRESATQMWMRSQEASDRAVRGEIRLLRPDGDSIWTLVTAVTSVGDDGEPYGLAQIVDISDRKRAELQLNELALHDALTGLPNRVLLESRIDHALQRSGREISLDLAVLFIDLDGFKEINDNLGHHVGDEALHEIAIRLQQVIRPGDTVARLGGDEFIVLCEDLRIGETRSATAVAGRVLDAIRRPGGGGAARWTLSASIGICQADGEALTPALMINRADAAMYRAKQQGKNGVQRYDSSMAIGNVVMPQALHLVETAISADRLRLHFQPVLDLRTCRVVGAEALLRLEDEQGRMRPPADFLAAAEAHGQIVEFGAWSLRQACLQAVQWKRDTAVGEQFSIAVNMSVKEVEAAGFLDAVDAALADSGLCPEALVIELTESAFLRDLPSGRLALQGLRQRGVKLALDDFGTGFSSLSYLRRFAVDIIKLDRSFVADLGSDERGAAVTRGLIALAHTLDTVLVAEGVEESEQAEILVELGAYLAQGYLFSRPVPAAEFTELLTTDFSHLVGHRV